MKQKKSKRRAVKENQLEPVFQKGLLAIVLLAFVLRLVVMSNATVEHFDEGVYSSNLFFPNHQYPDRHLYAPPFVPALIEWFLIFQFPAQWAPLFPAVLIGTATVALAGWLGQKWFSREAGWIAAFGIAVCEPHILYSTTALTDGYLAFFLLLSVGLSWYALHAEKSRWCLFAAGAAAAAWWTKYNGWLALGIPLGSLVLLLRLNTKRAYLRYVAFVSMTIVLWLPVLEKLRPHGGYASVSANHAKYLLGFSHWWPSVIRQLGSLAELDSGIALGFMALVIGFGVSTRTKLFYGGLAAVVVVVVGLFGGTTLALALAAAAASVYLLQLSTRSQWTYERRLSTVLLFVWWGGLTFAIPLYHPYPRLTLPWHVAGYMLLGGFICQLLAKRTNRSESNSQESDNLRSFTTKRVMLSAVAGAVVVAAILVVIKPRLLESRLTALYVVQDLERELVGNKPAAKVVFFVLGEPAVFYHLRSRGLQAAPVAKIPDEKPAAFEGRAFVIIGPHGQQMGETLPSQLKEARRFTGKPSWLVASNLYDLSTVKEAPSSQFVTYELISR